MSTDAEGQALRRRVRLLDNIITEHHAASVMRDEHDVCPVCSEHGGVNLFMENALLWRGETTGMNGLVAEDVVNLRAWSYSLRKRYMERPHDEALYDLQEYLDDLADRLDASLRGLIPE